MTGTLFFKKKLDQETVIEDEELQNEFRQQIWAYYYRLHYELVGLSVSGHKVHVTDSAIVYEVSFQYESMSAIG